MAKISIDKDICIGCGLCENLCPKSFKIKNGKAVVIKAEVKEISCEKKAEESCPVNAIEVR